MGIPNSSSLFDYPLGVPERSFANPLRYQGEFIVSIVINVLVSVQDAGPTASLTYKSDQLSRIAIHGTTETSLRVI